MATLPNLLARLRRFRMPPGRPSESLGVPGADREDAAAELAGVFREVDRIQARATATRDAAAAAAARLLDESGRDAAALVVEAERAAAATLSDARGRAAGAAAAAVEAARSRGSSEAAAISRRAAERTPAMIERLLADLAATAP